MSQQKYPIENFLSVKNAFFPTLNFDMTKIIFVSNLGEAYGLYSTDIFGTEIKKILDSEGSVTRFAVSPSKNQLVFLQDQKGNEQYQIYLLHIESGKVEQITNEPSVRYDNISWSTDGEYITYTSNKRNGVDFDVYLQHIETRETICITDHIEHPGYLETPSFSPTMRYITYVHSIGNKNGHIYVYDRITKQTTCITSRDEQIEQYYSGNIHWTPDEKYLYTVSDRVGEFKRVWRYGFDTAEWQEVLSLPWDIEEVRISEDGQKMFILTNENGTLLLKVYNLLDMSPIALNIPKGNVYEFDTDPTGDLLIFAYGSAVQNRNIWVLDLKNQTTKQLTDMPSGVPLDVFVSPEEVWFPSFDGLQIPTFIYKPASIEEGKKLPVIIDIHGGPESQSFNGMVPLPQFFVHHDFIIARPNIRGSSGYGKTYLTLDNFEKRLDSLKDIVALRDYLKTLPYVDETKIVLYGGSYGGFMVLAGLAFYPDLWAAGVDIVGIANFVTFLENTAPYRRAIREVEYGYLDKHRDLLISISPIHKAGDIQAPLMVIHGSNDPRVPLNEAEQIVEKVKENGVEVEFLVYPDEGHSLDKMKNKLDAYPKMVAFLKKALKL